jgi:hypothetical protein
MNRLALTAIFAALFTDFISAGVLCLVERTAAMDASRRFSDERSELVRVTQKATLLQDEASLFRAKFLREQSLLDDEQNSFPEKEVKVVAGLAFYLGRSNYKPSSVGQMEEDVWRLYHGTNATH